MRGFYCLLVIALIGGGCAPGPSTSPQSQTPTTSAPVRQPAPVVQQPVTQQPQRMQPTMNYQPQRQPMTGYSTPPQRPAQPPIVQRQWQSTPTANPGYGACPQGGSHVPGKVDRNGRLHCVKCGRFM